LIIQIKFYERANHEASQDEIFSLHPPQFHLKIKRIDGQIVNNKTYNDFQTRNQNGNYGLLEMTDLRN
jgi:hypothetical protein